MEVDKELRFDYLRRLHYVGRLQVPPMPTWETSEEIDYREMLGPITEPFDLKGAGFTYIRYLDANRQDDSWLYFPQTRRVRRLSSAQRSEGIYGSDIDLDSYGGFAANPAWFDFQLLGKKTLLAPMNSNNIPVKWNEKPADFLFDDVWQPRDVYIVAARSLLPGYNFSVRIIYIDAQSFLIPFTEVYDHDGQLWRSYVQQWLSNTDRPTPASVESVYDFKISFIVSVMVVDMQQNHTSRCQFPAQEFPNQEPWFYFAGESGTVNPDVFDVANFIRGGR